MATKYAVNPIVVGPLDEMPELTKVPVAAAQTYRKGQPFIMASGEATLCTVGDIPSGQFAEDCLAAVAQDTYIWVYRWNVGTRLEMYVVNTTGVEAAITYASVGTKCDLDTIGSTTSLIAYVDIGTTTDKVFEILDVASVYEPTENAAADVPGKCIVSVLKVT